ncbi:MAG: HEPN domain-containing protein [Paludibacteraceae bacterium]|nr:HEPN domain-containing protein [Paludibacteraceae bacterium]
MVDEDLSVAKDLFKTRHWLYTAFMCHQVVEKMLKAYWVATRDDDPPYIHDHKRLAEGCGLYEKLTTEQRVFLTTIREMNIEARYREYKSRIAASLNEQNTQQLLQQTIEMQQWIRNQF